MASKQAGRKQGRGATMNKGSALPQTPRGSRTPHPALAAVEKAARPGTRKPTKAQASKMVTEGAKKITREDVERVVRDADKIRKKFETPGPLGRFIEDFKLLISVVQDYWSGKYREIPYWTLAAIVFALLYVLWPLDFYPDFLPGGLIDDALVVAACLAFVEQDLLAYKEWKLRHSV